MTQTETILQTTAADLVAELGEILRPKGILGIGTDYKVNKYGTSRRYLVLESEGDRPRYAVLSSRPEQREHGVARMVKYTGLDEQAADETLDIAHALSDLNDVGAWTLMPRTAKPPRRTVDQDGMGDLDYGRYPALANSIDLLHDLLSHRVARIEVEVRTGKMGGRANARQAWYYFYDHDNVQVAAHTPSRIGWHLNHWLHADSEASRDIADRFMRSWGAQLHVSPDEMAAAYYEVQKLEQAMGFTDIDLGAP